MDLLAVLISYNGPFSGPCICSQNDTVLRKTNYKFQAISCKKPKGILGIAIKGAQINCTWKIKPTMVVPVFLKGGSWTPSFASIAFLLQRSKLNPPLLGTSIATLDILWFQLNLRTKFLIKIQPRNTPPLIPLYAFDFLKSIHTYKLPAIIQTLDFSN